MSKIKICGMQRAEDISAANEALPDFVGFIFVDWERHYITEEQAKEFKKLLSPKIKAVGAFVDAPIEQVIHLMNDNIIDLAQLHGNESDDYVREVVKSTNKPVIKAIGVKSKEDIDTILKSSADYILLDTPGGCTGNSFDWSLISSIDRPYFLAGGLNTDNITEAVSRFHPYSVDLSSGAETNKVKDPEKMKLLVQLVRSIK
jgi:phosphoribosylanthranilate isomerase